MSVLLINQGWTDNLGDIAIKEVMEYYFHKLSPVTLPFAPNVANRDGNDVIGKIISLYNLDKVNRDTFSQYLDSLSDKPKAAIIGGGELFGSNMNFNSALKEWIFTLRKNNIPVFLFGVSGNRLNKLYEYRIRRAVKACHRSAVRDFSSKKIFQERYCMDVDIYPDVVFTYGRIHPTHELEENTDRHDILCNILSYEYYIQESHQDITLAQYYEIWAGMLDSAKHNNDSIVLGSTTAEDQSTAVGFAEYLLKTRGWNPGIFYAGTPNQFWEQLSGIKTVVTGRMHAMILAKQKGCECIPFVFKEKISQFNKEYIVASVDMESVAEKAENGLVSLVRTIEAM